MSAKELRKLLEGTEDKLSIFMNSDILRQCKITIGEFISLVDEFLNDEEKQRLFNEDYILKTSPIVRKSIIVTIKDDDIKLALIQREEVTLGFKDYDIISIIESLGENARYELLKKPEFFLKFQEKNYYIKELINSLNDKNKRAILLDKGLVEQFGLKDYDIVSIISSIKRETTRIKMLELYELTDGYASDVLATLSDKRKKEILIKNPYNLKKYILKYLASTLTIDGVVGLFRDNKEFLNKNDIKPYEITHLFDKKKALGFISKIEDMGLSLKEKRQILATFKEEVKSEVDKTNMPKEYVSALETRNADWTDIEVDFNENLEKYRDLDELISVDGTKVPTDKLLELCEICPNLHIRDNLELSDTSVEEYKTAEKWIQSVLQGINPEWSDIQRVAFIDNAIGRKISYSPDFDTEVFDANETRKLWGIINFEYGVCNGIASVEKYILGKIGIETELVSSGIHSFLRLKNIELPTPDGKTIKGDTILDPTWNLTAHRYKALPNNFCKSYEEIRKHDIDGKGKDTYAHKNDEELSDVTLNLDEKSLRDIFSSIGIADKDGNFPIKVVLDESKKIYEETISVKEAVRRQLELLEGYCPEFATCQNSTMAVLQGNILNNSKLNFNKCVVKRVYEKEDKGKAPVLYVYINLPDGERVFYVADKTKGKFVEYEQRDFEARFECYEQDTKKQHGHRPWEDEKMELEEKPVDLDTKKVVASEGDER